MDFSTKEEGLKIVYPDGQIREVPADGTYFVDPKNLGVGYQWDAVLNEWVDHKGEIFRPLLGTQIEKTSKKKCGCGAIALGVDKHSEYCDLFIKENL